MPSFLGAHAKASLKAAVVNAENRNRLSEEDKCWRSHQERSGSSFSRRERGYREPKDPKIEIDRPHDSRLPTSDKWGHDGYFAEHPEEIGPKVPKEVDRFKFFAKAPSRDDSRNRKSKKSKKKRSKSRSRSRSKERRKKKEKSKR